MLIVAGLTTMPAGAADRSCLLAGFTNSFQAVKIELPGGSEFANIEVLATRPAQITGDRRSWHLAMGFAILDGSTLDLLASRIFNAGSATRRVVVDPGNGTAIQQEVSSPDISFNHVHQRPTNRLLPGTYYLVGFGTDGRQDQPNPWWGARFSFSSPVTCTSIGTGDTFDLDHSSMRGFQASASIAGVGTDLDGSLSSPRALTFGLMDVTQVGATKARLDYTFPDTSGTVSNEIVPFVTGAGVYDFTASFAGLTPLIQISGVSLDL